MSQMPPPTVPPTTPPPPGGGAYTPPPPPPAGGGPGGAASGDRTIMVILAYLWILAIIPLLVKKDDREVQWHAKNGLVILAAEIIFWILLTILGFVLPQGVGLGCGLSTVSCVVWIAFLVVRIICIVKGVSGQRYRVPVLSDYADKF
jgi:uncharacterized membrane protein